MVRYVEYHGLVLMGIFNCILYNKLIVQNLVEDPNGGQMKRVLIIRSYCVYFNGPMEVKSLDDETPPITIGRVFCPNEIRSIQQKATATWRVLRTCINQNNPDTIQCVYTKTVGVTKRTSKTSSSEVSASVEMGVTLGMEASDPFGVATTSMSASLTTSFGTSQAFSSSSTFQESSTETISTGAPVQTGKTVTICQAVGTMGQFTLNSPLTKVVQGGRC